MKDQKFIDLLPILEQEYKNGVSLTKLEKKYGYKRQRISEHLKQRNVKIVNQQNALKFDNTVFDVINTEEKAYWLGFLFADGYVAAQNSKDSGYTIELSLKGSDINHLKKYATFLKCPIEKVKLSNVKCNGKICSRCRCWVTDKHLWETLNSYGCTPRKSLTLQFPNVNIFQSEDLIRHFIRGYFDGDGCITHHKNRYSIAPVVELISTKIFLEKVIIFSSFQNPVFRHDTRHAQETWTLTFHKECGVSFINYIYNNASIYLERKFQLYQFFKNGSRSVEEFTELLSGNIGESL